jgi:hypothetical protein
MFHYNALDEVSGVSGLSFTYFEGQQIIHV